MPLDSSVIQHRLLHEIIDRQSAPLRIGSFPNCLHVRDVGLDASDDREIWTYAKSEDLVIVTKDQDFTQIADHQLDQYPKVVWVRLGNCRKHVLFDSFSAVLDELGRLLKTDQQVIEIQ